MLGIAPMAKHISGLEVDEILELFTSKASNKKPVNFRLSDEARKILDEEASRYGTDRTKALEILLREIRELRKRGKR